ncbi:hypothetical protein ACFYYH_20460 [Streptomyces sp. NPDC002018]|uniref:hypothetical protein n=1 Tax=Streptomyces sp. NPDC002018 TaxID=3364629 RepID=UPI00369A8627
MTGPLVPVRAIVSRVHSGCDLVCDHRGDAPHTGPGDDGAADRDDRPAVARRLPGERAPDRTAEAGTQARGVLGVPVQGVPVRGGAVRGGAGEPAPVPPRVRRAAGPWAPTEGITVGGKSPLAVLREEADRG